MDWRVVRLEDVPAVAPVEGRSREQELAALAERAPHILELWRAHREEIAERRWHDVRHFVGASAFGVNAADAPAGSRLIFPHDEAEHGQEEIYLVIRGRARYVCDGESGELASGELLYVRPGVHRELWAVEDTLLFLVGGKPGAFEPPIWAADWRSADDA